MLSPQVSRTGNTGNGYAASAPAVSLPKGGGAIQGIGEKFSVNPVTGTGSLSIPIAVSPGRGFAPELAVSYDSGAGNGVFGMGWDIGVPSIVRKTQKGLPQYQDANQSDVFLLSGAEDLVPVLKQRSGLGGWEREILSDVNIPNDLEDKGLVPESEVLARYPSTGTYTVKRYRPRTEGLFARIEQWIHKATGDVHWRTTTPDNTTSVYGKTENSRIADPHERSHIFEWLLCESYDDKGNVIVYRYQAEDSANVNQSAPQERNRYGSNAESSHDSLQYTNRYLKQIQYGNRTPYDRTNWLFQVIFDYGEHGLRNEEGIDTTPPTSEAVEDWATRQDAFSSYRSGFEIRTQRLCRRSLMFHRMDERGGIKDDTSRPNSKDWYLVGATEFAYDENPVATYLTSAIQTGYRWNFETGLYDQKSYPPVVFEYERPQLSEDIQAIAPESLENLPVGLDNATYQFLDLDGEGISGILTQQGGGWFYKTNDGAGRFGPLQSVAKQPALASAQNQQQRFMDLAGDGQLDLVLLNRGSPGFYERTHDQDWQDFRAFQKLPNVDWNDPNLRLIDLNGDGHADVLLTEDQTFVWHPSMAEAGFGPSTRVAKDWDEEKGPALVFADASQSVYLSDMSGDGLNDIVRIHNGAVCYWPNLGYGRFGAKVTMDDAPYFDHPEMFEQRRVRLADIDGSGTIDILYLGRSQVQIWFNQSGNGWSQPKALEQFPPVDNVASVQVVDLLGQGTACLVWSSPLPGRAGQQMWYVDLMGGKKPHLLTKTYNNLGAETILHYAPSTKFYLADKQAGKPWITKIPFPVHVLEKTETMDHISGNRFVSSYAYHHGYFDGVEREFRGFGYVEQWDTEEYETFQHSQATNDNGANHHLPPTYTRTWFHTGVYLDREHILQLFAEEYYQGDSEARLLEDTVLPEGLTLQEEREACRALRGQMLRQEVYAQDGSDKAEHPYTVTEANYAIQLVQPLGEERHGVFFTHTRESIAYHYERSFIVDPTDPETDPKKKRKIFDPRIAHQVTLAVDEFGNVLQALAVAYPRRQPQYDQQGEILATLTEAQVINKPGEKTWYRLGLPWEMRTYEVTGLQLSDLEGLSEGNQLQDLKERITALSVLDYEEQPDNGLQKRLLEWMLMRYRSNSDATGFDSGGLDWGNVHSLALPYESYELAFTDGLLQQVYKGQGQPALAQDLPELLRVADLNELLKNEGKYLPSEKLWRRPSQQQENKWWVPSGQQRFEPSQFYAPTHSRDPFGQETETTYDDYQLAVVSSKDAIGNTVKAEHDYWAMQPKLMTDPNGNRQVAAFDPLGMVVGTAVMGKESASNPEGDSLQSFTAHLTQSQIDSFFADPKGTVVNHLGSATTRIIYDLHRFLRSQQKHPEESAQWKPVFAATLAREVHVSDLQGDSLRPDQIQVSFEYSDGFGREVQTKVQAEPGKARRWDSQAQKVVIENADPRWVGTGRTIYNNKGKPIKQYEPFFSTTHGYEDELAMVEYGVTPILFYDPLGRAVATLHPNHTYEKVVFDPWQQTSWDVNDTLTSETREDPKRDKDVGQYFSGLDESEYLPTWYSKNVGGKAREQDAARKAVAHAGTPGVAHLDTLGRPFLTVAHNGQRNGSDQLYETWVTLDIEGNPLTITDARGNAVMSYAYEIRAGEEDDEEEGEAEAYRVYLKSMDAGERWTLYNVAGNPIREWDSRGFEVIQTYDVLQRPTHVIVRDRTNQPGLLAERLVYGEGHSTAEQQNLRGQLYRQYDGAGVVTNKAFDFKGNLLEGSRQLTKDPEHYRSRMNWSPALAIPQDFSQLEGIVEPRGLQAAVKPLLEKEKYKTETKYDALNRPTEMVTPDKSVTRPVYNEANLLEQMQVQVRGKGAFEKFVKNIDYDEKGQREKIVYGNGVTTTYEYEKETFRLSRLLTTRTRAPKMLQDLTYSYDPVGNITSIYDAAQLVVKYDSERVEPLNRYAYDALYRLTEAQGREHRGKSSHNKLKHLPGLKPGYDFNDITRRNLAHPNDIQAMRNYTQLYQYDEVGNILSMKHEANNHNWERVYDYDPHSNRLLTTTLQQRSGTYEYDDHGNMKKMPHLELMEWNFEDQLRATARQKTKKGNGVPETTYYVYDAGGQRVRKVTERFSKKGKPTRLRERIYLGGVEIYRDYGGDGKTTILERETLHVMDDQQRVAVVETKTFEERNGSRQEILNPKSVFRYQLGNHLGSASWELDRDGAKISYEEYYPYGSTSYQVGRSGAEVGLKRYRYTGKEKDEESGFYYHGARYYACWLGRWISADQQAWLTDGVNIYQYSTNNPVVFFDPDGSSVKTPNRVIPTELSPEDWKRINQYFLNRPEQPPQKTSSPQKTSNNWLRWFSIGVRFVLRRLSPIGIFITVTLTPTEIGPEPTTWRKRDRRRKPQPRRRKPKTTSKDDLPEDQRDTNVFWRAMSLREFLAHGGYILQRRNENGDYTREPVVSTNRDYVYHKYLKKYRGAHGKTILVKYTLRKSAIQLQSESSRNETKRNNPYKPAKFQPWWKIEGDEKKGRRGITFGFPAFPNHDPQQTANVFFNPFIQKIEWSFKVGDRVYTIIRRNNRQGQRIRR